jgi:hypothetical protein
MDMAVLTFDLATLHEQQNGRLSRHDNSYRISVQPWGSPEHGRVNGDNKLA